MDVTYAEMTKVGQQLSEKLSDAEKQVKALKIAGDSGRAFIAEEQAIVIVPVAGFALPFVQDLDMPL